MKNEILFGAAGFALGLVLHILWDGLRLHFARWHRRLWSWYWRWRSRRRGGRPPLDPELIALIRQMCWENPLWGAPRIHGELMKLGYALAQSTVSKYMIHRRGRPSQSWMAFLRNHAAGIVAVDMLTARTLLFERLYAFVVLAHDRRRIVWIDAVDRPTALWLAAQIAHALATGPQPRFMVRDNDPLYGAAFRDELRKLGIDDRPTQRASPWENGHVERLIGSIRRECLDHLIVLNAAHLRRVLGTYAEYYNNDRTHLALGKDAPNSRPIERHGAIASRRILGGLHRRYARIRNK